MSVRVHRLFLFARRRVRAFFVRSVAHVFWRHRSNACQEDHTRPFFFLVTEPSTLNALLIWMLPPRCDRRSSTPGNWQLVISVIPSDRLVANSDSNRPANRVTYYQIPPVGGFNTPAADPSMSKTLTAQGLVRQTLFEHSWALQI